MKSILFLINFLILITCTINAQTPPYGGTIFLDSSVILTTDPTTTTSITYLKQETRNAFDRRIDAFANFSFYVFKVVYSDGLSSEAQVNTEFGSISNATIEADKYGKVMGKLPNCLRINIKTITIHKGLQPFGGGNMDVLIHTDQALNYIKDGILEETLIHEASHTSLDNAHAASSGWLAAQSSDKNFISTYARDNPNREDIAESFLTWIMVRQCTLRIQLYMQDTIKKVIPARLDYFDKQNINLLPVCVKGQKNSIHKSTNESLNLFPNPCYDFVNIHNVSSVGNSNIKIINSAGQILLSKENVNTQDDIDLQGLPKGIYTFILTNNNGKFNQKLIKE